MKDFFVSYTEADLRWAEWIAAQLDSAGYSTIYQARDFRPGSNFVVEMDRATADAKRTLAVLSPDYLAALYTHPEWGAAFAQDPTGEKGILVPVRVHECELKGLLAQIVYIDFVGRDEAANKEALLAGLERGASSQTPSRSRALWAACRRSGTSHIRVTPISRAARGNCGSCVTT